MLNNWDSWINGDEWGYYIVGHIYIHIYIYISCLICTCPTNLDDMIMGRPSPSVRLTATLQVTWQMQSNTHIDTYHITYYGRREVLIWWTFTTLLEWTVSPKLDWNLFSCFSFSLFLTPLYIFHQSWQASAASKRDVSASSRAKEVVRSFPTFRWDTIASFSSWTRCLSNLIFSWDFAKDSSANSHYIHDPLKLLPGLPIQTSGATRKRPDLT
jgi:hypothetical protein